MHLLEHPVQISTFQWCYLLLIVSIANVFFSTIMGALFSGKPSSKYTHIIEMLIPVSAFVARTSETNTPQNTYTHISFVHRHRIPIIIIPNDANINRERESYPIWFWTKHTHTFVHTRVSEPRDDEWEIKRKVETSNIHCGLHNLLAPTKDADDVATGCWELNGVGDGDDDDLCGSVRERESSVCWHGTV